MLFFGPGLAQTAPGPGCVLGAAGCESFKEIVASSWGSMNSMFLLGVSCWAVGKGSCRSRLGSAFGLHNWVVLT